MLDSSLGQGWFAWMESGANGDTYHVGRDKYGAPLRSGDHWTEVLEHFGFRLPAGSVAPPPAFVSVGTVVRRSCDGKTVAHAGSKTMAQRIANALVAYKPGPKGY